MRENKFKVQTYAGKVMAGVLWDSEGILLGKFPKRGATVNSERYERTLKKLKHRIRSFQPNRQMYESVAYPGIFSGGGEVQQIQLRTEHRENGDLGR
jgi:hypothetical protein